MAVKDIENLEKQENQMIQNMLSDAKSEEQKVQKENEELQQKLKIA